MSLKRIQTQTRMSQAVVHGNTVYTAGQVAQSAAGESVTKQTENILEQIDALLAEAGTDNTKLISATIWLTDMETFAEMNAVWDAWVPEGAAPARACGSADLATPGFTVEITVIAAK